MKRFFLTAAAALALQGAMAQNSAVTNAILYQKQGQFDKARTEIDKAITNPKTSDKAKTWYTRGDIYESMMMIPGKYNREELQQKALESFQKTVELDGKTGEYGKLADDKVENMYGRALNAGVESYNAKKFDEAYKLYRNAAAIRPQDTTAWLYSAFAAEAQQDYAKAKDSYNKLLGINYSSPQVYNRLLLIARQEKNEAEASKILQQALKAYPNNKDFMLEELNVYLSAGRGPEAIEKIKKAIAVDPTNSNLYSVLGSVYDQNKQPEDALAAHKKAIELNPKNYDSQYNVGVYYFNKGADLFKQVNKMDMKAYQSRGKGMETEAKKYINQAIPYFEAATEVNPKERGALAALQKAYLSVGRKEDAERTLKQLDSL